jgi:glycosyltransferase involved in cell wall biosynthesis
VTRLSIILPVLDEAVSHRYPAGGPANAGAKQGVELVVVDGGSGDGTVALCAGLADQVIVAARGRARTDEHGRRRPAMATSSFFFMPTRRCRRTPTPLSPMRNRGRRTLGALRRAHRRPPSRCCGSSSG